MEFLDAMVAIAIYIKKVQQNDLQKYIKTTKSTTNLFEQITFENLSTMTTCIKSQNFQLIV